MVGTVSINVIYVLVLLSSLSVASPNYNAHSLFQRYRRQEATCIPPKFRCTNGECIKGYYLCDGSKDCSDGSDETELACKPKENEPSRCPALSFECSYGACIDGNFKCDGKPDCADESDEKDCKQPCPHGKFQCTDGACIKHYSICDGVKDCSDGTDETVELCGNMKCLSNTFQCRYGACLAQSVRCNGTIECLDRSDELGCNDENLPIPDFRFTSKLPTSDGGCILPQHPKNGVYTTISCNSGDTMAACFNTPGENVPKGWLLKYTCNINYDLTADSEFSVCENGTWKNSLDCVKLCPPLISQSVEVRCQYGGREVSCDKPMKHNTTVMGRCRVHYQMQYQVEYSHLLCQTNGEWNFKLFDCTPDCGIVAKVDGVSVVQEHILGGTPAKLGEVPWLTAIFYKQKDNSKWAQQCGGTLISPHIVLTAAHCLIENGVPRAPENIKVGLGKYYRDYNKHENYSIIADVRKILTSDYYSGETSNFVADIGLIDLKKSVQVNAYIMPACVDWSRSIILQPNETTYVSGWGKTENGTASETILSAQLRYVDYKTCRDRIRAIFRPKVTHDKLCTESIDGAQVGNGDSGGGLTIKRNEQHFVIGIVSIKLYIDASLAYFTDLANTEHHIWLESKRNDLKLEHL